MKQLNFDLKVLCKRNKDGSFATQAAREKILTQIANTLDDLGFRKMRATGLKPKHVEALVKEWQSNNLSAATIKNRMAHLRWWAQKINKSSVISADNDHYQIPKRVFVTNQSKALIIDQSKLVAICDQHIQYSLRLQELFGLRREESLKFIAKKADHGNLIKLSASWCKGGKERVVPIRNQSQRDLLNEIINFTNGKSLIPSGLTYIKHLKRYEDMTAKAGLCKLHGLRHSYAQTRYKELTGLEAPACGGLTSKELSFDQKKVDQEARLIISSELGHEREQVTAIYLGR